MAQVFGESIFNGKVTSFDGIETTDLNVTGNLTGNLTGNITGNTTVSGNVIANKFVVSAGSSTQFLKADGSIDSTAYASVAGNTAFPASTLMLFQQTSAPPGWTKQTTHNDKTLRVVSGAASFGGSTNFTTVFTSRTPAGTNSGGAVQNTTLAANQLPNHTHSYTAPASNSSGLNGSAAKGAGNFSVPSSTGATTGGAGYSAGAHSHGLTQPTFTGTAMDFAVQYVDLIIASKD